MLKIFIMESLKLYLKESYDELVNKVTWPSWVSLQENAILVVVASLLLALIVFVMDVFSSTLLDLIYGL
ncbi:MAG: preprotein translocase subunit SecE [Bacteroidetes bacterium]|nr:preprotein translocase subunit SecE [Bacteroidota bacterium]